MKSESMSPHGYALLAYFKGEVTAELVVERDDGYRDSMLVSHFFRAPSEFSKIEKVALEHCRGRVLDAGAGAGIHSLFLQSRGIHVTAIDISQEAAEIMSLRGVEDARAEDVFDHSGGPFDTVLILGRSIGMVETLDGLRRFLSFAETLVRAGGQVLLDSLDVRRTADARHLAYHAAIEAAGRYVGEFRLRFTHADVEGPVCGWLYVDPTTLALESLEAGWKCTIPVEETDGSYLARLIRAGTA